MINGMITGYLGMISSIRLFISKTW